MTVLNPRLLSRELKQWRQKVLDTFKSLQEPAAELPEPPNLDYAPISPPQPADPERNIIDQLVTVHLYFRSSIVTFQTFNLKYFNLKPSLA